MDQTVHAILNAADRLGEWEYPSHDYEFRSLWDAIDALIPQLQSIVGFKLDVDRCVQDASFLTDIGLLDSRYYDRKSGTGSLSYIFSLRFSNFGRLFTVHGTEWESRYDELRLDECINLLRSLGYNYIPLDALDASYDGINGPNNPICGSPLTWWGRFFDYM